MAGPVTWTAGDTKQREGLYGTAAQDWDEEWCLYGGRTGKNYLNLVINHLVEPRVALLRKGDFAMLRWHPPRMEEEGGGGWDGL